MNLNENLKLVLGRVENIVGRGENAGYQHFLLFPKCFKKPSPSGSLKARIVGRRVHRLVWKVVNPFPNKPCILRVCSVSLLKTLWEKEKLFETSNFSLSISVFYQFGELSTIFIKVKIVVCKLVHYGTV